MSDPVFWFRDSRRGRSGVVEVGFTDARHDLGDRATTDARESALAALAAATGAEPVLMSQVHGVAVATARPGHQPVADALTCAEPGLALVSRVADCVPVLLADADAGLVAAGHAGRAGVAAGVVAAAVASLRAQGAESVTAWIGPHVCGGCYEVPASLREEVSERVPQARAETRWGTPALDLGAGVFAQLVAADCEVVDVSVCTLEDSRFHSHRRDAAAAGRQAGVVWRHA